MSIAEFANNNINNANTGHTPFKLNCGYHPRVFLEEDIDSCSRSFSVNELAKKLKKLIEVCYQNFCYAQEQQKKAYNKGIKSCSYAPGEKIWLNSKYIKTKKNKKLESKFCGLFQVLYIVSKSVQKLELSIK